MAVVKLQRHWYCKFDYGFCCVLWAILRLAVSFTRSSTSGTPCPGVATAKTDPVVHSLQNAKSPHIAVQTNSTKHIRHFRYIINAGVLLPVTPLSDLVEELRPMANADFMKEAARLYKEKYPAKTEAKPQPTKEELRRRHLAKREKQWLEAYDNRRGKK